MSLLTKRHKIYRDLNEAKQQYIVYCLDCEWAQIRDAQTLELLHAKVGADVLHTNGSARWTRCGS